MVTGGIAEMSLVSQHEERLVRPRRGFAKLALKVRYRRDVLVAQRYPLPFVRFGPHHKTIDCQIYATCFPPALCSSRG